MIELVDMLAANVDLLPSKASERISLQRLSAKENERTAKDIMEPIPIVNAADTIQQTAQLIVTTKSHIVAIQSPENTLAGVVTSWDITHAISKGMAGHAPVESIMTREVISALPGQRILKIVRCVAAV